MAEKSFQRGGQRAVDVNAVMSEMDSATAMITVAKGSTDARSVRAMTEDVLRVYESAMEFAFRTKMDEDQEHQFWNRLAPIRAWLEVAGALKQGAQKDVHDRALPQPTSISPSSR